MVGECLGDDDLALLLSGEGDAVWRDRVERHIDDCGACRSLLADLAGLEDSRIATGATEEPSDPSPLAVGDRVDHFEILGGLGRGAMGEVYAARDIKLDRKVALKLVQPGLLGSAEAIARFGREARATARFNHPNIVTIHAVGEHLGQPYVALELLEGDTLQQHLERGALSVDEAIATTRAIAEALREAHRHGVLHRDLKPGNVHVGLDGRVRVLDFGLAKLLDEPVNPRASDADADVDVYLTRATTVTGTPAYMAPEQWRREPTGPATDVWALGMILYQMLTGQRPYADLDARALAKEVASERPVPRLRAPEVPTRLAELTDACLAKFAGERPSTTAVLERLDAGQRVAVRPARARLALGAVLMLGIGGIGAWSLGANDGDPEAAPAETAPATHEPKPPVTATKASAPDQVRVDSEAEPERPPPPAEDRQPPKRADDPPATEADEPEQHPPEKRSAPRRRTAKKQDLFGTRE